MERDREIAKLINVLRHVARAASQAAWGRDPDAARFCVLQYNKVLGRVSELEPAVTSLFTPLPENASPEVVRIAAHELAAYFEGEAPAVGVRVHVGCGGARVRAGWVRTGSCW